MARKLVVEIIGNADSLERALGKAGLATQSFGDKMRTAGRSMTTHLTLPILAVGGVSTKMAMDFQSSMTLLATQANVPQKDLAALSKSVQALAGPTATAPKTLSAGLYHLVSQGLKPGTQAMDALKIAAEGAKMGHADLEDVTNALGAVLASKISGVHSYGQAMGVLNATVGAGDMRMQDLADAMGTGLAASAAVAHVSLRQVSAALATLGDNNIRGAKAGTLLVSTLRVLGHQSLMGVNALQDLGISSDLLQQKLASQGLSGAIDYLNQRLGDYSTRMAASGQSTKRITAQIGSDLSEAFGGKQSTGIKILIDQVDRFHTKLDAVDKGGKTFASNWAEYTQTTAYKMDRMGASMQSAGITIGNILLPVVSTLVNKIASLANWFSGLSDTTKKTILVFGGIVAALGPVLSIVGNLAKAIRGVTNAVTTMVSWFRKVPAAAGEAEAASAGFSSMLGPLGIAVAAAGVAYLLFRSHTDELAASQNRLRDAIQGVKSATMDAKNADLAVAEARNAHFQAVTQAAEAEKAYRKVMGDSHSTTLQQREALGQYRDAQLQVKRSTIDLANAQQSNQASRQKLADAVTHQARELDHLNTVAGRQNQLSVTLQQTSGTLTQVYSRLADKYGAVKNETAKWLDENAKAHPVLAETVSKTNAAATAAEKHYQALLDAAGGADKARTRVDNLNLSLGKVPRNIHIDIQAKVAISEAITSVTTTVTKALGSVFGGGGGTHQRHPGPKHALGGIFSQPHIGWVAEQGAEAILPLTGPRAQRVAGPLAQAIVHSSHTPLSHGGGRGTLVVENHFEVGGELIEKQVRKVSLGNQRRGNRVIVGSDRPGV